MNVTVRRWKPMEELHPRTRWTWRGLDHEGLSYAAWLRSDRVECPYLWYGRRCALPNDGHLGHELEHGS